MGFISNTIPTTKIKIAPARLTSIVQNHYLLRVILFENEIGN